MCERRARNLLLHKLYILVFFGKSAFQKITSILNAGWTVHPSRRVIASSMLDEADTKITERKIEIRENWLVFFLTSDGYTNKTQVNPLNCKALTRLWPIHVATIQRTADEIWKDAQYVAGDIEERVEVLGGSRGTDRILGLVSDNANCLENLGAVPFFFSLCSLPWSCRKFTVKEYY